MKRGTKLKTERCGEKNLNYQGSIMRIIQYNKSNDIIVEFQDKYKAKVKTGYKHFKSGNVKNPYLPSMLGVGIIGNKYLSNSKEYNTWKGMLHRCYDENFKKKNIAYKNVTCCEEWLLFDNFYGWLHEQSNFEKWLNGKRWAIDKDILIKGNKVYSPNTCVLVSSNINNIFVKRDNGRGNLPLGVMKSNDKFGAIFNGKYLGTFNTPEQAFKVYKKEKESYIKQVAQEEYNKGNITKRCYDAMMKYEVEITD